MSLEVDFEVTFGREPTATDIALERTFARMRTDVYL